MGRPKVTDRTQQFHKALQGTMQTALKRMAKDILLRAKMRVPLAGGDLMESGHTETVGKLHERIGFDTDYAAYQERGKRRDGSHVVKNYSTPSTGKDFLKGAGEKVSQDTLKYLQQAANNTKGTA